MDSAHVAAVRRQLLEWYVRHGRDLPWRRTRDPYAILVSEVMLQQTQVERVIPKWHAWLEQFPTLADLARASRGDAIRAWQGLGYNLRAVRLHTIATQCVAEFDGELPRSLDGLLRLKGIGRYTAGAVACFGSGQPVSVVDTNVRRVLSRVFGVGVQAVPAVADAVLPFGEAYAWNQALMDLGATTCRSERPLCLVCPLLAVCSAAGQAPDRPKRAASAPPPFAGSTRYFRGRILDALRTLPDGSAIPLQRLAVRLEIDAARLAPLVDRLHADGLISRDAAGDVQLP